MRNSTSRSRTNATAGNRNSNSSYNSNVEIINAGSITTTSIPPPPPPPQTTDNQSKQSTWNRVSITILSLLTLWASSFNLCIYIANTFVPAPTFQAARSVCEVSYSFVELQREKYIECVQHQASICNKRLDANKALESFRLQQHQNKTLSSIAAMNNITSNIQVSFV